MARANKANVRGATATTGGLPMGSPAAAVAAAGPLLEQHSLVMSSSAHQRSASAPGPPPGVAAASSSRKDDDPAYRRAFDERLTLSIWTAATTNANPATDLLVCLERSQGIGFRYVDITRAVVIHHGSKDSRVPVDNVRWLGGMMKRCEVRVLDGEGHGLMASAAVMGSVLTEMAREWDDWVKVISKGRV
jgi:pimeloyl-ACP methyl ester carboxylesterase